MAASRKVHFEGARRADPPARRAGAGTVVEGPAIIEEYGSTMPIHPGFTATVDEYGMEVRREQ